ncbi:MAG: flagellar basal-body rod protein FlgF [Bradyrhizobium sp.]|nr:MAG: flagellar basal-body rod protein FlgF [Bradyrhizobium sp.]
MQNNLYVSLSAQVSLERRLETIANNVANMNTAGFRADGVSFSTELAKAGDNSIAYVSPGAGYISRLTGPSEKTDNPFDVAVQGQGWLSISTPEGVAYTRDGRMRLSETGALQTLTGNAVLDAGGAPIILDAAGGAPTIAGDGMITQNGRQVGAIGVFSIPDDARFTRAENSGVIPDKKAEPILDFTKNGVVQGYVEGSNVNPIEEMSKLIDVTRGFDGVNTEVTQTESSLQDAIKTLSA